MVFLYLLLIAIIIGLLWYIGKRFSKAAFAMKITLPLAVVLAVILLMTKVIIPNTKYNSAVALMEAGNLDEAQTAFRNLGEYKDAVEKVADLRLTINKEQIKNAKVGDYVFFGAYEQDNNTSNGAEDIEWLVLDKQDGKILIVSKYALDCKPYNTEYTEVTWESCSLRKWLNSDLINAAFSDDEKELIPTVTVSADKNPEYSTDPGNTIQDKVFLLSITEANKYFSSDSARQCEPTNHAVDNGAYLNKDNINCCWWLRSPGYEQNSAAFVYRDGVVFEYGYFVNFGNAAVRPALWISLDS